jgi:Zn-dependent protease with chaperone function
MYFLIAASLLFTFLLAINFVSTALLSAGWATVSRYAASWRPDTTASAVFCLRVLPMAISLIVMFVFVLPAFLLYEPTNSGETVGTKLWIIIGVGAFAIAAAFFRVFGSWWRTRRLIAEWLRSSERVNGIGGAILTYKLRHPFPVFAIVGVIRPRLFIAEQVIDALEESELAAVIEHELGHISARDNLKRLFMRVCGDILLFPIGASLDRSWGEAAELAADEYAVEHGGRKIALNLASALIQIARIIPDKALPPMPTVSFVLETPTEGLSVRVRRLLQMAEEDHLEKNPSGRILLTAVMILSLIPLFALATDTLFLARIQSLSETLLAVLQ